MKLGKTENPFRGSTKYLMFCCFVFAWGDILFGIDTGSFGSIQALPAWLQQFGERNAQGVYALTTSRQSIMNSVVWPGKLAGVAAFEPIAHRFGYKISIYIVAVVQIVALILELTAKNWIQFTFGRIVAYFGVGIVENAAPMYMAEIAPAPMRGALAGLVQVLASLGNLWGAGMGRAYATEMSKKGWLVPVGVQLIPAVMLIALTPFTVESPRWLLSRGRREAAQASLDRLRSAYDVQQRITEAEIEAILLSFEESRMVEQVGWLTLFRGTYLRRLCIGPVLFFFQQTNGGQFLLSYAPTFYKTLGLGTKAFTYNIVGLVVGVAGTLTYILTVDLGGRRTFAMIGTFGATLTEFIATGILVTKKRANSAEVGLVIACLSLFQFCTKIGLSSNAWVICTETAGVHMRQKLIAFGTAVDVLAAFVVTFTYPYIANPQGANLGTKTGWIFSSISACSFVFTVLMVPELKGRSLEEVDELFEQRLWAWQFKHAKTHGIGATMRQLEAGVAVEQAKAATEDAEEVKPAPQDLEQPSNRV